MRIAPTASRDAVRSLRLHLLRLHAEREALGIVLDAAADGRLSATEGAPPFQLLDAYLAHATGFLKRESVYGYPVSPFLEVAYAYDALVSPGRQTTLLAYLAGTRQHVRRAVSEATRPTKWRII